MDYELIWWLCVGAIGLVLLIGMCVTPSDHIDITWGKKRDWAREERKWGRK